MKTLVVTLFVSFAFLSTQAQTNTPPPASAPTATTAAEHPADAKIKFKKENVDFGTTPFNKPVTINFEFTNVEKQPVLIENVRTSCGCTAPTWTKAPVLPGKTGTVTTTYSANSVGQQHKTIWVKIKGVEQEKELHLTGTVQN
ncbi:DUF1573 domain-containing protein [Chitinophaga agri]|uniref:DUF1573 domain-containing protein n=1 Tax=Chitinophaga agri TaxID=2703787 RepID=A0A6B9ZI81_9BACT|nr:DUF1573 domain-containing protein [Chitinophaga agri]QHS62158.1 DUF1573 domain-containing protein [Chitinophaga agri]